MESEQSHTCLPENQQSGENGDDQPEWQVERDEFLDGIQDIKSLVGTGRLTDALAQVQSELLVPQPTPTAAPAQTSEYAHKSLVCNLRAKGASSPADASAAPKPVPDQLDSLETRGRILERMLGYFTALQETYAGKLQRLHEEQHQLVQKQAEEDVESAAPPLPAQIFELSPRSPRHTGHDGGKVACGSDQSRQLPDESKCKDAPTEETQQCEQGRQESHTSDGELHSQNMQQLESLGHEKSPPDASDLMCQTEHSQQVQAEVLIKNFQQRHREQIESMATVLSDAVESPHPGSPEDLRDLECAAGSPVEHSYDPQHEPEWVGFSEDEKEAQEERSDIDDEPDGPHEGALVEQTEGQDLEEDFDEEQEEAQTKHGIGAGDEITAEEATARLQSKVRESFTAAAESGQLGVSLAEAEEGEEAEASDPDDEQTAAVLEAAQTKHETAVDVEAKDQEDLMDGEEDQHQSTAHSLSSRTYGNSTSDSLRDSKAEATAESPSSARKSGKARSSLKKPVAATGSKRRDRKRDSVQTAEHPVQSHERGGRRASQKGATAASPPRELRRQSGPAQQLPAAGRASSFRPPVAPSTRQSQLPQQLQQQLAAVASSKPHESAAPSPAELERQGSRNAPPPKPTRKIPWPRLARDEVSCVQTLALGTSVRSAICVGHEVWTVDWSGRVVIRGSEDASRVIGEIPTNKFVWCMMHMEPGIMWMGQEAQGIALFDVCKKEFKGTLTGGHVGGVTCLASDDGRVDAAEPDGPLLRRTAWSASNDFTIRRWNVHTWRATDVPPEEASAGTGKLIMDLGDWKVSIARGRPMRGHKKGVRVMLQIGPTLWSGGDDGAIRIWRCADDTCTEVIEDAHKGAVLKMVIVRSYLWTGGSDGLIKEWSLVGSPRQCLRQVSPEGSEKGIYGLVPLGHDVWICGHHPMIQVLSQHSLGKTSEHKAHEPYISNLLAVDRVETRIVWSTSLGDKVLKVWRHTIRGFQPSMDELRAACQLFQADEEARVGNANVYIDRASMLEEDLACSAQEYREHLEKLSLDLAEASQKSDLLDEQRKGMEEELLKLRSMFENAGCGNLLQDPEAMHQFLEQALQLGNVFGDPALANLLQSPDELKQFLQAMHTIKDLLESLGMTDVLSNPAKLQQFLESAYHVKRVCERHGLNNVYEDPSRLQRLLEAAAQVNSLCENNGLPSVLEDPGRLRDFLAASNRVRSLCERHGLNNIYDDPSALQQLLMASEHLKKLCERHGLQYVFEDPSEFGSMLSEFSKVKAVFEQNGLLDLLPNPNKLNTFLQDRVLLEAELQDAKEEAARVQMAEERLCEMAVELADANEKLAAFNALGDFDSLCSLQQDAEEARRLRDARGKFQKELGAMQDALEQKEQERLEALERLRIMALKYKELDIFKLDIIARELKSIDGELGYVGKATRELQNDAGKLKHYDEQQHFGHHGVKMHDQCVQMRAHIRDVINKCLSETQKLHIGISVDDHMGAGDLQDGGVMGGYFLEEVDVPEHGNSRAARIRQSDELHRDKRVHPTSPVSLPRISSTPCLPPRAPGVAHDSARGLPTQGTGMARAPSPAPAAVSRGSPTRLSIQSPGRWSPH